MGISLLADSKTEEWLWDKKNFTLIQSDFQKPATWLSNETSFDENDLRGFIDHYCHDGVVIKPRFGSLGKGVRVLLRKDRDPYFTDHVISLFNQERVQQNSFLLVQQYIRGIPMSDSYGRPLAHAIRVVGTREGVVGVTMRLGLEGSPVNGAQGA